MKIFILYLFIILSIGNQIEFAYDNNTQRLTITGNGTINQIDNNLYNLYKEETKEYYFDKME